MSLALCLSPPRRPLAAENLCDCLSAFGTLMLPEAVVEASESTPNCSAARTVSAVLDRIPVEVLVEVFKHLDLKTAFNLTMTSKRFTAIFSAHRMSIILPIVEAEFSPFGGLLQAIKASPNDLAVPWGTWLDKRVRRKNVILCEGGTLPKECILGASGIMCEEANVEDEDLDRILAVCKTIRGWERIFPQHRFNALHCQLEAWFPERMSASGWHCMFGCATLTISTGTFRDQISMFRLEETQLRALRDLWLTVEDIIELKMCPSVDNVRIGADFELSEKDAARIGWGEQRENQTVVATICKLGPEELLHYLENHHKYSKARLVREIRQRHPHFEFDTESLGSALAALGLSVAEKPKPNFLL